MSEPADLRALFDRQQRIEMEHPGVQREVDGQVIRHYFPAEHSGFIAYSALDETNAETQIEAQVTHFKTLGCEFEWKVYDHDQPPDLRQRLARHGFSIEEPEALMVLDLAAAPDFYWTMDLPRLEPVRDAQGVAAVIVMENAVWGVDHTGLGERLNKELAETPDLLDIFAVWVEGEVVSAAWTFYHPNTQFASLWGGSTRPAYRRRGYYTALLAIRAREARSRGVRFLTVDASPMSRPILEMHGFQFLGYSTPCVWKPA